MAVREEGVEEKAISIAPHKWTFEAKKQGFFKKPTFFYEKTAFKPIILIDKMACESIVWPQCKGKSGEIVAGYMQRFASKKQVFTKTFTISSVVFLR